MMTSNISRKIQAAVLTSALLMPVAAAPVMANDWSKTESRTKGTVVGAIAGALLGGKKGAVIGAAVGNGVQYARHSRHRNYRVVRTTHYNPRTHRYYTTTRRVYGY